jgi:hypothetical protein
MKKSRLVLDFFILRQLEEFIIKLSPDLHRSEKKSGRNPAVLLRDPPPATKTAKPDRKVGLCCFLLIWNVLIQAERFL